MALGIKDVNLYDKVYGEQISKGGALICPRCKGGHGKSEVAKKRKYKDLTDVPCFTCWAWLRKEKKSVLLKSEHTKSLVSVKKKPTWRRSVVIRRVK